MDVWVDRRITVGKGWLEQIHERLLSARIALLLVSADFLNSQFIQNEEVPKLLDRHKDLGMTIVPVLIRDCLWELFPWLQQRQFFPGDGVSLAEIDPARLDKPLADLARNVYGLLSTDS